ncbi:MAG: PilN domain-containing protein [Rhodanobacter sp.]
MAHVNLLPWRAERRKQREREFFMQLAAAFAIGLAALLLWYFWMGQRIDNQNDRNAYLQTEIKQLDVRIAQIKDLEKTREHLLARKQIIEELQADRSQMVHLFDELVKTTPSSARLTGLKQAGDSMTLDGVAQSNASVAEYMRNIEVSPWMGHADLRKTENTHNSTRMPYTFGLNVTLRRPKADEAAANGDADDATLAPASTSTVAVPAALGAAVQKATTVPPAKALPSSAVKAPQAPAAGGAKP